MCAANHRRRLFIVCSGIARRIQKHLEGGAGSIAQWARARGAKRPEAAGFWMIIDYGDVITVF